MPRTIAALLALIPSTCLAASHDGKPSYPSFDYRTARIHEIMPHQYSFPLAGVRPGFNNLRLRLTVSPAGDVLAAEPSGKENLLVFWPQVRDQVLRWKFTPFKEDGKAITVEVEEYISLVPPERLPVHHVDAPVVRPDSKASITLERSACLGTCPAYKVTVSTEGIDFDGREYVVPPGKFSDGVIPSEVRKLAQRFVDADFYSMDDRYIANVTDLSSCTLSITIDGRTKTVVDYIGTWVGMPGVIVDLENAVDQFAQTQRWIGAGQ